MSPILLYSAILLWIGLLSSASDSNSTAENKAESKHRSGRWNQPGTYINAGEYASPSKPYYSVDSDEDSDRKDKSKYSVPTSFAEFLPDQKYGSPKGPSKSSPPPYFGDWKGYSAYSGDTDSAPWAFPGDVVALMHAMKEDSKETGLLAKLKAEPIAVFLGIVLPLTLILAAVWPSILNFFMGGMAPPPVTTTASGDNGDSRSSRKGDDPSFIVSVLEAIEKYSEQVISDVDKKSDLEKEKKNV